MNESQNNDLVDEILLTIRELRATLEELRKDIATVGTKYALLEARVRSIENVRIWGATVLGAIVGGGALSIIQHFFH